MKKHIKNYVKMNYKLVKSLVSDTFITETHQKG